MSKKSVAVEETNVSVPDKLNKVVHHKISQEDFAALQGLKSNVIYYQSLTAKAAADQKIAELEVQNTILRIYLKYGLHPSDTLDNDGNIVRFNVSVNTKDSNESK